MQPPNGQGLQVENYCSMGSRNFFTFQSSKCQKFLVCGSGHVTLPS